jgi:hypothetical protein
MRKDKLMTSKGLAEDNRISSETEIHVYHLAGVNATSPHPD